MKKKKHADRNKLVKKFTEHRPLAEYKTALHRKNRGRGIYILYKDDNVYYIGLSKSSLRSRLRQHATKVRHKGKWNFYSFYQVGRTKYIKDIETLLLRIIRPKGNSVSGRFWKKYDLSRLRK